MDFDFRDLEIFSTIVELKSFTRAAEKVYLAQASVSERISNLEARVGAKLLDRLPKGIELTSVGKLFYEYSKKLLELRSKLLMELKDLMGLRSGTLELGGSTVPGEYILPAKVAEFLKRYPLVKINLVIGDSKVIREGVLNGTLEVGVVGALDHNPNLKCIPIWQDQLVLCVNQDHRFYGLESISLEEALKEPFVIREKGSGTLSFWERGLKEAKIDPERDLRVVARLGSTTSVKEAVKSGLGVSVISERAITGEIKAGYLWPLKVRGLDMLRKFYLIWDIRRTLSVLAKSFVDFILETVDVGET